MVELSGVSQRARLGSARPFVLTDTLRGSNSVLDERWVFQCPWASRRLVRRPPVDPAPVRRRSIVCPTAFSRFLGGEAAWTVYRVCFHPRHDTRRRPGDFMLLKCDAFRP